MTPLGLLLDCTRLNFSLIIIGFLRPLTEVLLVGVFVLFWMKLAGSTLLLEWFRAELEVIYGCSPSLVFRFILPVAELMMEGYGMRLSLMFW